MSTRPTGRTTEEEEARWRKEALQLATTKRYRNNPLSLSVRLDRPARAVLKLLLDHGMLDNPDDWKKP